MPGSRPGMTTEWGTSAADHTPTVMAGLDPAIDFRIALTGRENVLKLAQ
jgi:hypothetical protein